MNSWFRKGFLYKNKLFIAHFWIVHKLTTTHFFKILKIFIRTNFNVIQSITWLPDHKHFRIQDTSLWLQPVNQLVEKGIDVFCLDLADGGLFDLHIVILHPLAVMIVVANSFVVALPKCSIVNYGCVEPVILVPVLISIKEDIWRRQIFRNIDMPIILFPSFEKISD